MAEPDPKEPAMPQTAAAGDPGAFTVQLSRQGELARLLLSGELDIAASPLLEDRLRAAEADGTSTVLIDLAGVTFMDSAGLHTFLRAAQRAGEGGRRLTFANCPDSLRRVFQLTRMEGLLEGTPL
jgi:anti-anti-sigma factor